MFSWVSLHRGVSMPFPWWSKTCFFLLQNEVLLAEDILHHLFPMTVFRDSGEEECGKISDLLTPHLKNLCWNIVIFLQNNKYWIFLSLYFSFLSLEDTANLNFFLFPLWAWVWVTFLSKNAEWFYSCIIQSWSFMQNIRSLPFLITLQQWWHWCFIKWEKNFFYLCLYHITATRKKRLGMYICIFFYVYIFELSQAWKISVLPEEISQDFVSN